MIYSSTNLIMFSENGLICIADEWTKYEKAVIKAA